MASAKVPKTKDLNIKCFNGYLKKNGFTYGTKAWCKNLDLAIKNHTQLTGIIWSDSNKKAALSSLLTGSAINWYMDDLDEEVSEKLTFKELKDKLIKKFKSPLDDDDLDKLLQNHKKNKHQTWDGYAQELKDIASEMSNGKHQNMHKVAKAFSKNALPKLSSTLMTVYNPNSDDKNEELNKLIVKITFLTGNDGRYSTSKQGSVNYIKDQNNNNNFIKKCVFFQRGNCKYGSKCKFLHKKNDESTNKIIETDSGSDEEIDAAFNIIDDTYTKNNKKNKNYNKSNNNIKNNSIIKTTWILDSGSTRHITNNKNIMTKQVPQNLEVKTANGELMVSKINGNIVGKIELDCGVSKKISINNIDYIENLSENILSISLLSKNGYHVIFYENYANIKNNKGKLIGKAIKINKLYKIYIKVKISQIIEHANYIVDESNLQLWHCRTAHLNYETLKEILNKEEIKYKNINNKCESCILSKHRKMKMKYKDIKNKSSIVNNDIQPFKNVVSDSLKLNIRSKKGKTTIVSFICKESLTKVIYCIKSRTQIPEKFKQLNEWVKTKFGYNVQTLKCDGAPEYIKSKQFKLYLKQRGIKIFHTNPHSSTTENPIAERFNLTIMNCIRAMFNTINQSNLKYKLGKKYWPYAACAATYILNRLPIKSNSEKKSSYEIINHRKPTLKNLRIWGSNAYVQVPGIKTKFLDRSRKLIFIGYNEKSNSYMFLNPKTNKKINSTNAYFDEISIINQKQDNDYNDCMHPEYSNKKNIKNKTLKKNKVKQSKTLNKNNNDENNESENETLTNYNSDTSDDEEYEINDDLNNKTDNEIENNQQNNLRRSERLKKLKSTKVTIKNNYNNQKGTIERTSLIYTPKHYEDAITCNDSTKWEQAINNEIESIIQNNTFQMVDLPPNKKPIGYKWVFKVKYKSDATIERYKARITANGGNQRANIDYFEIYSPVASLNTIRVILTLCYLKGYKIHQLDVDTAFLNGDIEEEIYMKIPDGYLKYINRHNKNYNESHKSSYKNKVLKFQKCLYGLKQSNRNWYKKFSNCLKEIGFKNIDADSCVFIKNINSEILIIILYVDDIIICCKHNDTLQEIKTLLMKRFKMKDLKVINYF